MQFFIHYRSSKALEKYEVLTAKTFEDEFVLLEEHVKVYWSLVTCRQFFLCVRTTHVESFFSTRLYHLPKHIYYHHNYVAKLYCCAMQWNANHISKNYSMKYGLEKRKCWAENVPQHFFDLYTPHLYKEIRGRKQKASTISTN